MKRPMVLSLLTAAVMLLSADFSAPAHAQTLSADLKPTFLSPTPGFYVNGWPAFTVTYPKEWVEQPPFPGQVYRAAVARRPPLPGLIIGVVRTPLPLNDWAKIFMPMYLLTGTDVKVLSDKPSQLRDGAPAREVELEYVPKFDPGTGSLKDVPPISAVLVLTKKDATWVSIQLIDAKKIGEDLKQLAYSLTFLPGKEAPVQVPPDVRAFLDMYCADVVSGDVESIMGHFSDRFLQSSATKTNMQQWYRNDPASPVRRGVSAQETIVTVFEAHGDKAYVDGYHLTKAKGDANVLKGPIGFYQIINEHGQWKWFGNQK
jgi:hypothetical protein